MAGAYVAERIQELGLVLNIEAIQALEGLQEDHAFELLEAVKAKVDAGHIRNPSNYISCTIARGYVTEAAGGAVTASAERWKAQEAADVAVAQVVKAPAHQVQPHVPAPRKRGFESAHVAASEPVSVAAYAYTPPVTTEVVEDTAARLMASRGMQKAQEAGLSLSDEAVKALLHLPPAHSSELLETVAEKHATLRDPSNYVVATVARGFVPKVQQVAMATGNGAALPPTIAGLRPATFLESGPMSLVPPDVTPVESRVLELNAQDLWPGQQLSAETLLALRCVDEEAATQLLVSLEAKGRGKGSTSIKNPNNYVQAAVVKIKKGSVEQGVAPAGGSLGYRQEPSQLTLAVGRHLEPPNPSRQRANELRLDLDEATLKMIEKIPVKDCNGFLEAATWIKAQNEDPNEYVHDEAQKVLDSMEAEVKRPRWV